VRGIQKSKIDPEICGFASAYMSFQLDYNFDDEIGDSELNRRNDLWMPILLQHLDNEKVFAAMGIFHLYGRSGIIQQLIDKGFEVPNPVTFLPSLVLNFSLIGGTFSSRFEDQRPCVSSSLFRSFRSVSQGWPKSPFPK
jgi:hypothetical protein